MMTYGGRSRARRREKEGKRPLSSGKGPFLRLVAAVGLFLICFVGKTQFPTQTAYYQQELKTILTASTDFRSAFANLGKELAQGNAMLDAVGDWCVAVFAPQELVLEQEIPLEIEDLQRQEAEFFVSWQGDMDDLRSHLLPGMA